MIGRSRPRTTGENKRAGKKHPSRPGSRNGPDGKGNDPKTDRSRYNEGRRPGGRRLVRRVRRTAGTARGIPGTAPGTRDRRVPAISAFVPKSGEDPSHWGLIRHSGRHPDGPGLCGLSGPYRRSWHQPRISETGPAVLQKIIARIAGGDAVRGALPAGSGGFGIARHVDWQDAKYGRPSVRLSCKLHIMHTPHGMVCAAVATPGKANDSPYLRTVAGALPEGDGDVLADAACGGVRNRSTVRDSGRRAVIDSKSNAVIRGFGAGAEMPGFREGHPGTFCRLLRLRNNAGSAFPSVKARFGGAVRVVMAI